jgi:hypothetical protein
MPPAMQEAAPVAAGAPGARWIPGYWSLSGNEWVWMRGHWE